MTLLQGVYIRRHGEVTLQTGLATDPSIRERLDEALAGLRDEAHLIALDTTPRVIAIVMRGQGLELALLHDASEDAVVFDFLACVPFAMAILKDFLANPYGGITVADRKGIVRYISPLHEKAMGLSPGEAIGRLMSDVVPGSRLQRVIDSGKAEIGDVHIIQGAKRIVNRVPIWQNGEIVGAIGRVMLKAEAIQSLSVELSRLEHQVKRYQRQLDRIEAAESPLRALQGDSLAMQQLKTRLRQLADLDVAVLILGESGTGKELVAKALHGLSSRAGKPLVSLNLAALPTSLVESELFGYAAGTFTGATREGRPGKFEQAHESTLFLDEVGDIPLEIQVKLLRVLEDQVVERLGSHAPRGVKFRLISATHRNMEKLLESQHLRLDLYYRLAGVTLRVPPLRERLEDIPILLQHFVTSFCRRNDLPVPRIHARVATFLAQQAWPGNVRQLRQAVEEAVVFASGKALEPAHFQHRLQADAGGEPAAASAAAPAVVHEPLSMQEHMAKVAHATVLAHGGNKNKAAASLGISRSHLYKLLAFKQ